MTIYTVRPTEVSQRLAYGKALAAYGDVNEKVVVLDADVSSSTFTSYFASRHPKRFFNLGVTEDAMVNVGAGMALGGMTPFVNTFASLLTLRACEPIRTCVAYARTNVKLVGNYAGLSDYKDGPTHFALNDVAIMRAMPNLAVLAPADATEAAKMVRLAAEYDGPVYMRISRAPIPDIYEDEFQPEIGKGMLLRSGTDVTLVGSGSMVARCLLAADELSQQGFSTRVISMTTIKPIDRELLLQAAEETHAIVTAEDHSIIGGLGSAVAEVLSVARPTPLRMVGVADSFAETGLDPESLMDAWGLSVADIVCATKQALMQVKDQSR
jgi:transketolase